MPIVQNVLVILGALGPIFCLIMLGHVCKRQGFPSATFWPGVERLTYFVLLPALLAHRLALADLGAYAVRPVAAVIAGALLLMSVLLFLLRPLLGVGGPAFSSIYQGGIRFNTYVGLAAAGALFHQAGLTLAALAMAIMIPLINLLCVAVLAHASGAFGWAGLLGSVLRNPLILACLLGIGLNLSGLGLPLGSAEVLDLLARAALPLGLLAVGAGLRLEVALTQPRELLLSTGCKLLALPALTYGLSTLIGLGELETAVLVLFAALPGAPSAYILARQLGGDAPLMAAIVTVETVASMATLPVIMLGLV